MGRMTMQSRTLASEPGWCVNDLLCTAGPHDRPFEERHDSVCIAAVAEGTFQYRSTQGRALLAPGAVLLGNQGRCFECGHEHGTGDRCLSFHFAPDFWEDVAGGVPGVRTAEFGRPSLPPLPALAPCVAAIESACEEGDREDFEELALQFAGAVASAVAGAGSRPGQPSRRDERRVAEVVRLIETEADDSSSGRLSLQALAREAGSSPYHFLRTFSRIVGVTPHQFVLRTRLHRAAVRLRRSDETVSTVAFGAGFNDLSTFNRRFRRVMGVPPSLYRRRLNCLIARV
jgi:AraC-like DNA-binding protein